MSSLFFWNSWVKEYRYLFYGLAGLFFFTMLFLWYSYFRGPDGVITWQNLQEQRVIETNVHSFRLGPFVLDVPGESYVILEYFNGSQITPDTLSSYVYLSIFFIAVTVLISLITVLEKLWYYVGISIFIVLIVTLRLEVIGLFGVYNKFITGAVLLVFAVPAFYFNRFKPSTPFIIRLSVFAIITAAISTMIAFFSAEPVPFYHIVLTSFPVTLILSLIFMIIVAHEIFAGFVYMATQGSTRSIQHLSLLSAIYFVNVLITLLHEIGLIDFEFIYINLFLLLTVSAILGIWGFRKRELLYENLFSFNPFGAILFLTLGAICFATIGHQVANANDPGVMVLRHAIIFSHAAYGVIFLLYLLSNFGQMLSDNGPAYKALYLPRRMPYFTYRLAGFISMLAIVIYAGWRQYVFNSFAAFYNTAGDFHGLLDNELHAKSFYTKASSQGAFNHRSNYLLGSIHASRYNFEEAHKAMWAANARRPTEYSLTNSGNVYLLENNIRGAIGEYRRNLEKMPSSGALSNNIAVGYIKVHNLDSAGYYLSKAREKKLSKQSAETNFFGMAAMEVLPFNVDSIYRSFENNSPATLSNVYALTTVLNTSLKLEVDPLKEKQLNLYTATLLNNYIIKNATRLDTAFTSKAFRIASDSINSDFTEALKASLAFAYYHQGNIAKALEILAEQVYLSQSYQGKFNYIMGLWALEQNNADLASTYFKFAETYEYKEAPFYHAIALTEAHRITEALSAWDSVSIHGDDAQKQIAGNLKRILSISFKEAVSLPDGEKYQYCRYKTSLSDSTSFNRLANSFQNENYKVQALLDYSKRFFEAGQLIPSIRYYERISGLPVTDKNLFEEVRHFELRLLASRGEVRGLATQINKGIEFPAERNLEKMYYTALLNESSGDTTSARANYAVLARYNPYFEDGIIAAFNFFKKQKPDGFEAYNILAEAIQINGNSIPLLRVYSNEALRVGLDEYAASAAERIIELEKNN
jgi:hypothetical protein